LMAIAMAMSGAEILRWRGDVSDAVICETS
jgi:hypothetical protein